jgi:sugar (pentulose or hexulose) kinase
MAGAPRRHAAVTLMPARAPRHVAVIDIGKANAKVVLVDLATEAEIATRRTPNRVLQSGVYPHFDVDRLWAFILQSLAELQSEVPVEAIVVTTHGASAALVDASGALVLPVLDYEHTGPEELHDAYDRVRPPFSETGSPRLPIGLNLAAQFFWQRDRFATDFARTAAILTYPQYWAMRLSGTFAAELTSLGCHTDLWTPMHGNYSIMVDALGWRTLFPPIRRATDVLGPVLPEIAARTGIAPGTPIHCGIHDSNASLYPHLLRRAPAFAVVSTGTWVVCLSVGGKSVTLDPGRDTLINVNALGDPVSSARFMGGRENEILAGDLPKPSRVDIDHVLDRGVMYLPAAVRGSGPFPSATGRWTTDPATPGERRAAVSFYLALMTATCLELCGADGPVVVEGPFTSNQPFLAMLRAAVGRPVELEPAGTGTAIGAALLTGAKPQRRAGQPVPNEGMGWSRYAQKWRERASTRT